MILDNRLLLNLILFIFTFYSLSPVSSFFQSIIPQSEFVIVSFIASLMIFSFIIVDYLRRRRSINFSNIDLCMCIWGTYQILSYSLTNSPSMDIITFNTYFTPFIFYIGFRYVIQIKYWEYYIYLIIFCITLQLIFHAVQSANFHLPHFANNMFFNSGLLGGYLSIGIISILSVFLYNSRIKSWENNKQLASVCILTAIIYVSMYYILKTTSRASLVAVLIPVLVLIFNSLKLYSWKSKVKKYKIYLIFFSFVILLCGVYQLFLLKPDSANGRLLIWRVCLDMLDHSYLFGHGLDGFRQNYMLFQAEYLAKYPASPFSQLASDTSLPFNEYLKIFVEQGILGVFIFIGLLVSILKVRRNKYSLVPQCILICILLFGLFSYPSEAYQFRFIFTVCLTLLSCISPKNYLITFNFSKILKVSLLIPIFIFYGNWGLNSYNFIQASNEFKNIYYSNVHNNETARDLKLLYPQLNSNVEYLSFYGSLLYKEGEYEDALVTMRQLEKYFPSSFQQIEIGKTYYSLMMFDEAHAAWILASNMSPMLVRPHYLLAKSYYEQKKYVMSLNHIEIVLKHKPKVNLPEIHYMKQEMHMLLSNIKNI